MSSVRVGALAASFVVVQLGCILFVNESTPNGDQFSTTCQVLDVTSACGACIQAQCADLVTACCTDSTCKGVLQQFDTCADAGTCAVDLSSSAASSLGTCIDSKCTMCNVTPSSGDAGGNTTTVDCSLNASLGYCFCEGASPGSKPVRCDTTTVPNAICCAETGYPNSATCTCSTIKCEQNNGTGGCSCSTSADGDETTCDTSFGPCCANDGFCTCDPDNQPECDQFTSPVANCNLPASIGCGTSRTWVTNCSLEAN